MREAGRRSSAAFFLASALPAFFWSFWALSCATFSCAALSSASAAEISAFSSGSSAAFCRSDGGSLPAQAGGVPAGETVIAQQIASEDYNSSAGCGRRTRAAAHPRAQSVLWVLQYIRILNVKYIISDFRFATSFLIVTCLPSW